MTGWRVLKVDIILFACIRLALSQNNIFDILNFHDGKVKINPLLKDP